MALKTKLIKKKIVWITADYFIDVDKTIVPHLMDNYTIQWLIIKGSKSNIELEIPTQTEGKVLQANYRSKNPLIVFFYLQIIFNIKKQKPDLVYVDFVGFPFFHPLLYLIFGAKNVVHAAHNIIPYDGWPNKFWFSMYVKFIFRTFQNFHIFSKNLKGYFDSKYPNKKSFHTPLALKNYGESKYNSTSKKVGFLFFGNIKQNKRLDILINAFKKIPEETRCKSVLTIAGYTDETEKYLRLIDNDASIICKFRRIADSEIPDMFSSHKFLVLPYENVAQSGPHMIAYNYGIPVIATNISGFSELVEDKVTGHLFDVNDIDMLSQILIHCIEQNIEEYEKMAKSLSSYINDNFLTKVIVKKYINFFEKI